MTTKEVAAYLRIKERRVYELLRQRAIPCTKVTGKWLFPKQLIDLWLQQNVEGAPPAAVEAPPVIAGSEDPLLEWAVKESGCGLAMLGGGSLDGIARLAAGEAMMAGIHLFEPEEGGYNVVTVRSALAARPVVLIEWARRRQGLLVAPGNPKGVNAVADLKKKGVRLVQRQEAAGSQVLLSHLLEEAGIRPSKLDVIDERAKGESDLALAIQDGAADVGLGVEAAARRHRLDFIPLAEERFDLLIDRRSYFEPPAQTLFAFARSQALRDKAAAMGGYDLSGHGQVRFNGV
jgi:excisionase family DNA binding protein